MNNNNIWKFAPISYTHFINLNKSTQQNNSYLIKKY